MIETKEKHYCTKCQKVCDGLDCGCTKNVKEDFEIVCDKDGAIDKILKLSDKIQKAYDDIDVEEDSMDKVLDLFESKPLENKDFQTDENWSVKK